MKVAVTGSSGHLGNAVVDILLKDGHAIKALQHKQGLVIKNNSVEIITGELNSLQALNQLVSGCETVIHCAGKISMNSNRDFSVYEINVEGTKNIFNTARQNGVRRFIHISSIHAYHQMPKTILLNEASNYCSDNTPRYDQSKRDAQKFVLQQQSEMEVVVINPTAIVGAPDHKPSLTGKAILDLYNKKLPALLKGGFDFCDVRDVAQAVANAIELGRKGESYLLSGKWHSMAQVAQLIATTKGEQSRLPVLPAWMGYAGLPFVNLLANKNTEPVITKESIDALNHGNINISSAKAKAELNYHCRPLNETIIDLIEWFKLNGFIK